MIAKLSKEFSGTFRWDGEASLQHLTVTLRDVAQDLDGLVVARGSGRYDADGRVTAIDVKWWIDPANRRFEMWEANPTASVFETEGSHVGTISSDLRTVSATWTTRSSGRKGILFLEAR